MLAAVAGLAAAAGQDAAAVEQGRALYEGRLPLQGRIAGHEQPLPPRVAACTGCHLAPRATVGGTATPVAPLLDAPYLLNPQPRRNGPPSSYSATSLCRALRTGIDPASVTLLRSMPRYELSDAQCVALWAYLTTPPIERPRHADVPAPRREPPPLPGPAGRLPAAVPLGDGP